MQNLMLKKLWTLMLKGFQNEAKMDAGAAVGSQLLDFGSQNLQNITKTAPNIDEKSELRRGCLLRQPLARQSGDRFGFCRTHLGAIFDQKSQNLLPKRHAKFDAEKVLKMNI